MSTTSNSRQSRKYDLVLLGATGYTGRFAAQHINASLPTDLKWALAGRSQAKLATIAEELKKQNGDRTQAGMSIEASSFLPASIGNCKKQY